MNDGALILEKKQSEVNCFYPVETRAHLYVIFLSAIIYLAEIVPILASNKTSY